MDTKNERKGEYFSSEIFNIGGRKWLINFSPKEKFNAGVLANPAYFIFPAGVLISFFLFFFVRTLEKEAGIAKKLEQANKELLLLSSRDGLTEISNRRHFDIFLDNEWRRCLREQKPVSLIMADLDFFKDFNDGFGHHAGDECLKAVAKILQKEVNRPGDLAARYGGEEFVLIFSGSDLPSTTAKAERIREAVKELEIPHGDSATCQFISISLGVATVVPKQWLKKEKLMKMADEALYKAKQEGRNRVISTSLG
jgi:diguanylate cyclase (GGDEF)-like protein